MSLRVRAYVAKHSKLTRSVKALLLQIAHYAGDDGTGAYPSIATLQKDCGISPSTVHRALKEARQSSELAIQYNLGTNGTNLYRIRLEKIGSAADLEAAGLAVPSVRVADTPCHPDTQGIFCSRDQQYSSLTRRSSYHDAENSKAESNSRDGNALGAGTGRGHRPFKKPKWCCPRCLKFDCRGCPGVLTDGELVAAFDAVMRDTVDVGKPGPAQLASEAALRNAYANWRPFGPGHEPQSLEEERAARERKVAEWEDYERQFHSKSGDSKS